MTKYSKGNNKISAEGKNFQSFRQITSSGMWPEISTGKKIEPSKHQDTNVTTKNKRSKSVVNKNSQSKNSKEVKKRGESESSKKNVQKNSQCKNQKNLVLNSKPQETQEPPANEPEKIQAEEDRAEQETKELSQLPSSDKLIVVKIEHLAGREMPCWLFRGGNDNEDYVKITVDEDYLTAFLQALKEQEERDKSIFEQIKKKLHGLTKFEIFEPEEEKIEKILQQIEKLSPISSEATEQESKSQTNAENELSEPSKELFLNRSEEEKIIIKMIGYASLEQENQQDDEKRCKNLQNYGIESVKSAKGDMPQWFADEIVDEIRYSEIFYKDLKNIKERVSRLVESLKSLSSAEKATEQLDSLQELASYVQEDHKEQIKSVLSETKSNALAEKDKQSKQSEAAQFYH